ncbi:hypothetical protein AAC387_Pa02g5163 [Persea americana]|eukprot:TRINITY_DN7698_c0_g1_i7.p1 TRINITY_DN7698_c0_g1~~TRINITY_DN7698_c0_g1_i7.p1  ORF type:complete len:395 (+),score=67.65 TRINITY_DN7698_c0_g1_i7:178-1362(+)
MGLSQSTRLQEPPKTDLQQQIARLERELKRQTDLQAIYRAKLERMQEYHRACLQIAQKNGFLDIITKSHELSSTLFDDFMLKTSPRQQPATTCNPNLVDIADQAKLNGWYIEPNEIELYEQVGQGSTADIYRGMWRGFNVAVKCICPDFFHSNENSSTWFAQELETLSRQRHPFVLRLMGACFDLPGKGWVVTEFLSGRTLKEWLHGLSERRKERLTPLPPIEERLQKGVEIALAMQYLHEQRPKVIHRDLKPSNIFLDDAMHVRVADFGHARLLNEEEQALTGETGTYIYMAPEVIRCEPYNEKCDVYSFGIILNELITGQYPYIDSNYSPMKIALEVGGGRLRPTLPEAASQFEEIIDLICHSWDENALNRPSFAIITSSLRRFQEKLVEDV